MMYPGWVTMLQDILPAKNLPKIIDLIHIFACYQDQKTFQAINYLFSYDYILL